MALPKHTARRSGRIFQYHIPDHWIIRSQEDQEDYGVDFEIQIAEKDTDVVTPHIFKLQLKGIGTDRTESDKATFAMEIGKLKQYEVLEIPIFLIVVYTQTKEMFWVNLQNNAEIKNKINKKIEDAKSNTAKWQKTITDIANKIRKNNPNVNQNVVKEAENKAINDLSVSIELPYKFELADNIIDTKKIEDKFHEIYHYLWKIKPRKLTDFSIKTLNQMEYRNIKELFDIIITKLNYKLDNECKQNILTDEILISKFEIENLINIIKIYSPDDLENEFKKIDALINRIEKSKINQQLLKHIELYAALGEDVYANVYNSGIPKERAFLYNFVEKIPVINTNLIMEYFAKTYDEINKR